MPETKIGSVPTPWPSWLIAAHPSAERAPVEAVQHFLANLTTYVRRFDSEESRAAEDVDFITEKFGYPEEDIKARLECYFGGRFSPITTGLASYCWLHGSLCRATKKSHTRYLKVIARKIELLRSLYSS
jgi:hypothetical protein